MSKNQIGMFLLDALVGGIAYYVAFVVRLYEFGIIKELNIFLTTLPFVVLIKAVAFHFVGLHKGIWKHASVEDLLDIIKSATLATLGIIFVVFTLAREGYPRSVPFIDWLLTIFFIGGMRLGIRMRIEASKLPASPSIRALIVGAGDAGTGILKEIKNNPKTGYNPIGFIDDDPTKQGRTIQGIPILGTHNEIPKIVYKYRIQEIIIAIPSASGEQIRKIVQKCKESKAKFKTLPALADIINGTVSVSQVKEVDVVDLLRREPIELNSKIVSLHLFDKKVIVTGAGGSIGSELCRQIAKFHPQELMLLDMAETPLFWIERDIIEEFPNLSVRIFLADIRDFRRMEEIIMNTCPHIIYHAAAYKHVPMIEKNEIEGIKNNILGTQNLASLADKCGVESFVMISTDKAVNPQSFMGISKRVNELYIQALDKESKTKFVVVRFGNVLDSSGSCLPVFKRQIRTGQPITITHPDARRFFMTLPEAAQLIIEAGAMGRGGEIFILKMGEPLRIMDIAKDLAAFSEVDSDDVKFSFIGLRPGEKLEEELIGRNERVQLTSDEKILVVQSNNHIPYSDLEAALAELRQYVEAQNTTLAIEKCKSIIDTFS